MNTREQFGKYLLLKKLTEDPLGETFRAGLLGEQGMERVSLLRIFNGQGLDGGRLWQAVESRGGVQKALRSSNIGDGIEMGQLEGIPFVSYDYISGKNMANLLEQAARKRNYIPAEHALLITERIALALASAAETRYDNQRIQHGFLVPHLVIISNEGETRLLGFEVGVGLRSFAQNPVVRQHFGRYLPPEALAGQAPDKADDIYSLGVILFELLTGKPLPPPGPTGFGPVIDQGVVATEATPIPPELASLLKQSLVMREHRMKDIVTWHKTLHKFMFEGQYNPTTFNLAFFMHNLFRQEIEKESQEIEVEKTLPLPTVKEDKRRQEAPPPAPAPAVAPGPSGIREGTAANEKTENFIPEYAREDKKSKTGLILGSVAAVLVLAAAAFFFLGKGGQDTAPPTQVAALPPAEPEYTGPSEEDVKAEIAALVSQQSTLLQQQYDEQLANLQKQLEQAQTDAAERRQREIERKAQEEKDRIEAEQVAAAEEEAAAEAAAEKLAAEKKAAEEEAKPPEPTEEETKQAQAAAAQPKPMTPTVVAPPTTPQAAAGKATQPQVRRGDLVELGPGVSPPTPIRAISARYPAMARRFNKKNATVLVRVLIDENGEVLKADVTSPPQQFGFDTEALQAAKRSTWTPATKDGVPVKVWQTLTIEFRE